MIKIKTFMIVPITAKKENGRSWHQKELKSIVGITLKKEMFYYIMLLYIILFCYIILSYILLHYILFLLFKVLLLVLETNQIEQKEKGKKRKQSSVA